MESFITEGKCEPVSVLGCRGPKSLIPRAELAQAQKMDTKNSRLESCGVHAWRVPVTVNFPFASVSTNPRKFARKNDVTKTNFIFPSKPRKFLRITGARWSQCTSNCNKTIHADGLLTYSFSLLRQVNCHLVFSQWFWKGLFQLQKFTQETRKRPFKFGAQGNDTFYGAKVSSEKLPVQKAVFCWDTPNQGMSISNHCCVQIKIQIPPTKSEKSNTKENSLELTEFQIQHAHLLCRASNYPRVRILHFRTKRDPLVCSTRKDTS